MLVHDWLAIGGATLQK